MKCVITVFGKDKVGIIAKTCAYLSEVNINILDISQTIVDGYFNMMMIVDLEDCAKEFGVVVDELEQIGEEMGCVIKAQREDIFEISKPMEVAAEELKGIGKELGVIVSMQHEDIFNCMHRI